MMTPVVSQAPEDGRKILTVSKLNQLARNILTTEIGLIWITAEISNFVAASSGHWYFTLKDSRAQVRAAMFRNANRVVRQRPKEGDKVLVRASVSLYEPRGDYQLIIEHMQADGEGLLKLEYEQRKQKLQAEGLFDAGLKQPLPEHIRRIGIITSPHGAALHDVLTVLKRRNPSAEVVIYPTLVQGEQAAGQIIHAIDTANARQEVDVLLMTRGGGAIEDLWCFNDEALARTIAASQLPIVSAVGHEIDFTIGDFVADLRAPTPSAGAELLSRDTRELQDKVSQLFQRLHQSWQRHSTHAQHALTVAQHKLNRHHPLTTLHNQVQTIDRLSLSLRHAMTSRLNAASQRLTRQQNALQHQHPERTIAALKTRLSTQEARLIASIERSIERKSHALAREAHLLQSVSPLATLTRGYSITFDEDKSKAITRVEQIAQDQTLITRITDGEIVSKVTKVIKQK